MSRAVCQLALQSEAFWIVASIKRGRPIKPLSQETIAAVLRQAADSENEHLRKMASELRYGFLRPHRPTPIVAEPISAFINAFCGESPCDSEGGDVA